MNLSRFFGATNREALRQVRLALGPDAFIVSNRRVNGGVEIMATDQTLTPQDGDVPVARPALHQPRADADVMGAIGAMRGELESRIDELLWGSQLRRAPQAVSLFQSLLGFGFSTALLRAMLKRLPENLSALAAFQWARNELITHLPVLRDENTLLSPAAAIALVGPTGVGKTTTIAKLATRCVQRFGADNVVLLTTDTYRIGAYEQLKLYGQMMKVSVQVAQNGDELTRLLATVSPQQIVLIDNVGISQRDDYVSEQAAMLAGASRNVTRLLVLNAASHGDTLDEVARMYAADGGPELAGCIITKIDEANRLGGALDTAIRYRLPIHYVSNGQRVPQDLLSLDSMALVDRALVKTPASQGLYAPSEADLIALMETARSAEPVSQDGSEKAMSIKLLPGLLSFDGAAMSPLVLDQASAYIDENIACFQAYELWRRRCASDEVFPGVETLARQLAGAALTQSEHGRLLAVHGRVSLRDGHGRGQLRSSVLLDGNGRAQVSPLQQLTLSEGWSASDGATLPEPPADNEALLCQVRWFEDTGLGTSAIHMLAGGSQALWRSLSADGIDWVAQCTGAVRVDVGFSPSTVAAVAKNAKYSPVSLSTHPTDLSQIQSLDCHDVAIWAASTKVGLKQGKLAALPVNLLCVRIVRRDNGAVQKTLYGLSNVAQALVDQQTWPLWLLAQSEVKAAFRYAAHQWQWLGVHCSEHNALGDAMTAMQSGLAAWHIVQSPGAARTRATLQSLAGSRPLTAAQTSAALFKLFAAKAMRD